MYKIIGADWKEYGPISADTVREWIKEGRATPQTRIQAEGSRDWKLLSECPEWADILPPTTGPGPMASTSLPGNPLLPPQIMRRFHGLAVTALVLGSLDFLQCCSPFTGLLGVIFAIAAWIQINQEPDRYKGKDLAIAGIVLAVLGFVFTWLLYWFGVAEYLEKLLREMAK
jgi:hypothetical protein